MSVWTRYPCRCGQCREASDEIRERKVCRYSAAHVLAGIEATTEIDCGPVGIVPACQKCADFFARMNEETR